MYGGLHVKFQLVLFDFNATLIFSRDFPKNNQLSNFTKIPTIKTNKMHYLLSVCFIN